jgi:short subunit fatty acids transporter
MIKWTVIIILATVAGMIAPLLFWGFVLVVTSAIFAIPWLIVTKTAKWLKNKI